MILFDNLYYLLYNFFERNNLGTLGYKLTSTSITGFYFYFFICILYYLTSIFLFVLGYKVSNIDQNFLLNADNNTFVLFAVITIISIDIRYYVFKNINQIHYQVKELSLNTKERLDLLTITHMVTSPFLLFFLADFLKNLYK